MQVEAFGQWTLNPPKATNDLQPPLNQGNPLMDSLYFGLESPLSRHPSGGHDDKWLSQVEIVTHVGPHRRLWMGPQFCFKTLRPAKDGLVLQKFVESTNDYKTFFLGIQLSLMILTLLVGQSNRTLLTCLGLDICQIKQM